MLENESTSTESNELSDERIDELTNSSTDSNAREIPMTREEQAPSPKDELMEFVHNGKPIKGTREQIIKWAQQGYDYPQKTQKLLQERTAWESDKKKWEGQWGSYRQIDEWAKTNPDKWMAIQNSFQQAHSGQPVPAANPNDPTAAMIQSLKAELGQVKGIAHTWQEQMAASKQKEEDQKLDQEVQSIQEKYKDLDWKAPDENGKSLEYKVLEHARENGIKSFNTAFKDFYHDELIARAENQAKQNVSKGIQTKTKLGILGESPTPKKSSFTPAKDVKNKSYESLESEALEELRSGAFG